MMILQKHADNIRRRIIEESYKNQTAHVGSCLSAVEIMTVLFFKIMKPGDRFIMSPGHKALLYYSVLVEKGILDEIDLKKLGGHPIRNPKIGIEVSTGSLGHGLSLGCGLALAGNRTYVLLSDGDFDEGSTWEAIMFAGKRRIGNLMGIVDCNRFSAYRKIDDHFSNYGARLQYFDWNVKRCDDGHSLDCLKMMMGWPTCSEPTMISANTIKGKGLPRFEYKLESHYWRVTKEDL